MLKGGPYSGLFGQFRAMKNPFQPGDVQVYHTTVTPDKLAHFAEGGPVHPVYSTFALAHDAEWVCRLFVLQMTEPGEEGVGSYLTVEHISPALLGSEVHLEATLQAVEGNLVRCTYAAYCGKRLLARGEQHQRILNKARFEATLQQLARPGTE
jgi:predicted thioesterase